MRFDPAKHSVAISALWGCVLIVLSACQPIGVASKPTLMALPTFDPAFDPNVKTATPIPPTPLPLTPTPDTRTLEQLCFDLDKYWDANWVEVINVLERVRAQDATCADRDPMLLLYPAYYNYGVLLERRGARAQAIAAYQRALEIKPDGAEAAAALKNMNAYTPAPLKACEADTVTAALGAIPAYVPQGRGDFVRLSGSQFVIGQEVFRVRGVNYYPSRAPWRRFLTETNLITAAMELDLIKSAGLNTIRIFLWYDAMFDCPGSGLVPVQSAFERLDAIMRLAAERDLKLIVTLNDLPDLTVRPLYTHPETALAQSLYIVMRYRDERAILAWDLRNEGDIDYTRYQQRSTDVLNWLKGLSLQVRAAAPNHLITAGWLSNPLPTDQAVDFFSIHHWSNGAELRGRVEAIRAVSGKPILLEEVGYNTWGRDYEGQAAKLRDAITVADSVGMLGWVVWAAFDYPTDATCIPPACPSRDNGEHHFGLWHTDYREKAAVRMLRTYIGGG